MSFEFRAFELNLRPGLGGTSCALIGATKSGKSTLMKYIVKQYFRRHVGIFFSMNSHTDIYKEFNKEVLVSNVYRPELISMAHTLNKHSENRYPFLFITDDYVDGKIKNDPEILRLLTLYRNANMSSIQCFQRAQLMSATGRSNTNYIFIFKQNTASNYEDVVKEFLSMYLPSSLTLREMVEFCVKALEDHHFFVVDTVGGNCYLSKLSADQIAFCD